MTSDASDTQPMTPDGARAALDSAATAEAGVRARAQWMHVYMIVFGIGFGAAAFLLGMVDSVAWRMGSFAVIWLAFVTVMVRWGMTRPASVRGAGRRMAIPWIGTSVIYGIALFVGIGQFQGQIAYWGPVAVVIALPLVLGGLRERRS